MTIYYKYYIELKNRFFLLFLTWASVLVTCFLYKETILFILVNPSNYFEVLTTKPYFIFTSVSEIFYVYLEISFFVAKQIVLVLFFYHFLVFLALGLYEFEYDKLRTSFKFFVVFWVFSIILLYKFVIPYTWSFFLSFQQNKDDIQFISFFFEAKIVEYFEFFTSLYYICFINCQFLAIIVLILSSISEKLKKTKTFRKLFYFIFVLFSTLTTPPDIISQIILSLSLILVYETIVFFKYIQKTNMVTS